MLSRVCISSFPTKCLVAVRLAGTAAAPAAKPAPAGAKPAPGAKPAAPPPRPGPPPLTESPMDYPLEKEYNAQCGNYYFMSTN